MFAVFTAPDAVIIAALLAAVGGQVGTWISTHRTSKQTKPNGGTTMRDSLDRIEATLKHDVVPRLDHGAQMIAQHADRLAALEARPKIAKPRKAAS